MQCVRVPTQTSPGVVCTRSAHRMFSSASPAVVMVLVCLQVVTSAPSSSISSNTSSSRCPDDGINLQSTAGIHLDVSHLIDGEPPKPWSIPRSSQLSIPCNESNLSPRRCHRAVYTQESATEENDGCNWFWEKRYSENRLPQVFVQARITKEGQSPNTPCYSSGRRCRLIFFNQLVPRRECDENARKFKWALNFEKIAVGASCQKL